jgi:MFS family permease
MALRRYITLPAALRYSAYRNFWLGLFGAVGGFQVLMFGQFWLIHELTGSPLYLGYVGMANAIPAIILNLIGGVLADRADKKRLIVVTQILSATLVFVLGILTFLDIVKVWHVMVIAILAGAINAFNQPARQALYPHLIDRESLTSAVALNSAVWTGTRIVAPAIAGILIAGFGTASSFFFAFLGMIIFALVVHLLKVPEIEDRTTGNPTRDLLDGLKFIKDNSIFFFLISMTFFNSFFGMAYVSQMPVFARDILKIGADGQGVLLSINGIGSLLMTLWIGLKGNFRHRGIVLIGGAIMSGLSVTGFALSSEYVGSYALAIMFMFLVGVFTSTYMISIMSSLQMMVPDYMRGRIMGFYGITWNIMPLGGMYAGVLAGLIGTPMAIAIGGLLVAIFALGPALFNIQVRNLGILLFETEEGIKT